ncbi:MAG: hypothetical protein KTM48_03785, partial [Wolbachia endosymbiont of Pissodes strobi]|nr:hypothetical protein [Wolbachia endosymbiont of Pissodes strobi]
MNIYIYIYIYIFAKTNSGWYSFYIVQVQEFRIASRVLTSAIMIWVIYLCHESSVRESVTLINLILFLV